jgi:hypothetical protein
METIFKPPKQIGLILLIIISLISAGFLIILINRVGLSTTESLNILHVLGILIVFALLLFLAYRLYMLLTMQYTITRDYLSIQCGLRREQIPMNLIEWVRPASDLGFHLPMPWFYLPGIIVGKRSVNELGPVEFIGTIPKKFILVAIPAKVFVLSPMNVNGFSATFSRMRELGSLESVSEESVTSKQLISSIWKDAYARWAVAAGLILSAGLFVFVSLLVNSKQTITWFDGETISTSRLFLLPILNSLVWLVDFILGVITSIRGRVDPVFPYILWLSSCITGILLFIGVSLIAF